jgi:hypothetical protein
MVVTVSDLALIVLKPTVESFAQEEQVYEQHASYSNSDSG